jgi:class 3 adenylate cyclase/tetratricopeptide (TPR) repeat protein
MRSEFGIDREMLEDVRHELIFRRLAVDEGGEGLAAIPATGAGELGTPAQAELLCTETSRTPSAATFVPESSLPHSTSVASPLTQGAERRQLTVMFCDLVGSTALSTQMDPEDLRDVITGFQDLCREAIKRYDGFIARYMGDGMLVYFGYPQAHEDDAVRATRSGLDIISSMSMLNDEVDGRHNVDLAVRIGIATGPVIVGDFIGEGAAEEAAVVGETPNLAARLQGVALPNQLVVAPATHRIVSEFFMFEDLGTHELKGIVEPTQAWRVVGTTDIESSHGSKRRESSSPFVGRKEELGLLTRSWDMSKDGHGQVVLVQGEPGVGKSRLLAALRERLADEDYTWVSIQCSPYHTSSSLYPIIEHLKRAMNWQPEDDDLTRLEKLEKALHGQRAPLEEVVPLYADLMSLPLPEGRYPVTPMTPEQQREATLDAVVGWLLEIAESKPVVQICEDLHWADPTTLEVLGQYIDQSPTVAMLNVLTFRPEFIPPWPMRSHVTPITLNRLERAEVEAFVNHLAASKPLPEDVLAHIMTKADGVPLYVEELTKTIIESGVLREESDRYLLDGALSELQIPSTLQDSLMARLDRTPTLREVAQMAAVLGREFAYEMLQSVISLDETILQSRLDELVNDELLYQRGRGHRSRYIFKHALIQDAAYESLLRSTRRQVHKRIAESLESRFPKIAEEQPELLGHHYTAAGVASKALDAWEQAAKRAVERSANVEAIAYLNSALTLIADLPDTLETQRRELSLQTALAGPLITIKGYGAEETGRAFARAQELSSRVGATAELFPVLYGRWVYGISWLEYAESMAVADQFFELAMQQEQVGPKLMAHRVLGISQFTDGQPKLGLENLNRVIELYDADRDADLKFSFGQDPCAAALAFSSLCRWELGCPDEAMDTLERCLSHAESIEHVNTQAYVQIFGAAPLYQLTGNVDGLKRTADIVNVLADKHRLVMWKALVKLVDGWLSVRLHQDRAGIELMNEGLESARQTFQFQLPYRIGLLAEAHLSLGDTDAGLSLINEALELSKRVQEHWYEPELYRLKAELLFLGGDRDGDAENAVEECMRIARARGSISYELRGAITAVTYGARLRDHEINRQRLAVAYGRFQEGFDTDDLRNAAHLLSQVS